MGLLLHGEFFPLYYTGFWGARQWFLFQIIQIIQRKITAHAPGTSLHGCGASMGVDLLFARRKVAKAAGGPPGGRPPRPPRLTSSLRERRDEGSSPSTLPRGIGASGSADPFDFRFQRKGSTSQSAHVPLNRSCPAAAGPGRACGRGIRKARGFLPWLSRIGERDPPHSLPPAAGPHIPLNRSCPAAAGPGRACGRGSSEGAGGRRSIVGGNWRLRVTQTDRPCAIGRGGCPSGPSRGQFRHGASRGIPRGPRPLPSGRSGPGIHSP